MFIEIEGVRPLVGEEGPCGTCGADRVGNDRVGIHRNLRMLLHLLQMLLTGGHVGGRQIALERWRQWGILVIGADVPAVHYAPMLEEAAGVSELVHTPH